MQPDGCIVYDIQDEKSRNGEQRPFPFFETQCPRRFAQRLQQLSGIEPIVYQALDSRQPESFASYLHETLVQYQVRTLVFVGGGFGCRLSVPEATRLAAGHVNPQQLLLGGITIPERHRDRGNEHERIFEKHEAGVAFFTSQVVYNADNAISMLRDYDELCRRKQQRPARVLFAFAPFGRKGTKEFLEWLGVEIAPGTSQRVLRRPTLQERIDESIEICWENLRRILDATDRLNLQVPLGLCVESVSKFKDEQKAAEDLFCLLRRELEDWYHKGHLCTDHRLNVRHPHHHPTTPSTLSPSSSIPVALDGLSLAASGGSPSASPISSSNVVH
jgi:hypothetical protein